MRDSQPCWQKNLAQGFSCAVDLLDFLHLPRTLAEPLAQQTFRTRVPRGFALRMQPGNPLDPLLLQVLAVGAELRQEAGYAADPLHERAVNPIPGLIHKYKTRVLLTVTGACAVNCRYCFRRHFPYDDNNPGRVGWSRALDYVAADAQINEVILSGGDPLLLKDESLVSLMDQIASIPQVKTLRIHSRIPVVLPERMTDDLLHGLASSPLNTVVVLHVNHAQELDQSVADACSVLRDAGCHLLNQSVLLKGINNSAALLATLSERLWACGILPYYLHVLDKVQGVAHFDVPLDEARQIFQELQTLLPGYLVPRLAQEEPGKPHKTLL